MGSADVFIDVKTIGLTAYADDVCTQFMKHFGCNVIACTVGTIDHDFQTVQILLAWKSGFAKLNIAIVRTRNALAATQIIRGHGLHGLVD